MGVPTSFHGWKKYSTSTPTHTHTHTRAHAHTLTLPPETMKKVFHVNPQHTYTHTHTHTHARTHAHTLIATRHDEKSFPREHESQTTDVYTTVNGVHARASLGSRIAVRLGWVATFCASNKQLCLCLFFTTVIFNYRFDACSVFINYILLLCVSLGKTQLKQYVRAHTPMLHARKRVWNEDPPWDSALKRPAILLVTNTIRTEEKINKITDKK